MARPRKAARLWLDEERDPPEYYILDNDGGKRVKKRTHCGAGGEREAASVLAAYVTARDAKAAADAAALKGKKARKTKRDPSEVTIRPVDCRKAFEACVERARERFPHLFKRSNGMPKRVVRHTLRHTGVTLLSQWGVPARDICDYAGMSPEVYDRVYKHSDPERMDRVMDALGGRVKAGAKGRRKAAENSCRGTLISC